MADTLAALRAVHDKLLREAEHLAHSGNHHKAEALVYRVEELADAIHRETVSNRRSLYQH